MTLKKYGTGKPGSHDFKVVRLPFRVKDIYQVYIGKQGCACGCGGNYYSRNEEDPKKQKTANRMIKMAYNKVKKLGKTQGIEVVDNYIYSWEGESRAIRIYLHD